MLVNCGGCNECKSDVVCVVLLCRLVVVLGNFLYGGIGLLVSGKVVCKLKFVVIIICCLKGSMFGVILVDSSFEMLSLCICVKCLVILMKFVRWLR